MSRTCSSCFYPLSPCEPCRCSPSQLAQFSECEVPPEQSYTAWSQVPFPLFLKRCPPSLHLCFKICHSPFKRIGKPLQLIFSPFLQPDPFRPSKRGHGQGVRTKPCCPICPSAFRTRCPRLFLSNLLRRRIKSSAFSSHKSSWSFLKTRFFLNSDNLTSHSFLLAFVCLQLLDSRSHVHAKRFKTRRHNCSSFFAAFLKPLHQTQATMLFPVFPLQ